MSVNLAIETIVDMLNSISPTVEATGSAGLMLLTINVTTAAVNDLVQMGSDSTVIDGTEIGLNRYHNLARDLYTKSRGGATVPKEFIRFVWSVGSVLNWAALEARKAP